MKTLDDFLEHLAVPKSCELNKPIFKKLFLENGLLDATDKNYLKNDVEKIRWLYTLKSSTINIAPYKDSEREYPEVAVLHIELSNTMHTTRIANFIQRSIPYPLLLIFTCNIEDQLNILIGLADKRINQADKEKWVVEDSILTGWINLSDKKEAESKFLDSMTISNLSFSNFFEFYKSLTQRVIAIKCASHSGKYSLDGVGVGSNGEKPENRLELLLNLEQLESQKLSINNKLKKEKQMGKQVELNIKVKLINDDIAQIKNSL